MIGRSERLRAYEDAIASRRASLAEAERRLSDIEAERATLREWIVHLRKEVRSLEREHAHLGRAVTRPPIGDARNVTRPPVEARTMTRPPPGGARQLTQPATPKAVSKSTAKKRARKTRSP